MGAVKWWSLTTADSLLICASVIATSTCPPIAPTVIAQSATMKDKRCKLSDLDVVLIRQLYHMGRMSMRAIAAKYDVSHVQIYNVIRYEQRTTPRK